MSRGISEMCYYLARMFLLRVPAGVIAMVKSAGRRGTAIVSWSVIIG
jgi:hypothetical protein